jgi:hypothetical protein
VEHPARDGWMHWLQRALIVIEHKHGVGHRDLFSACAGNGHLDHVGMAYAVQRTA